jgi:hypothetical protein
MTTSAAGGNNANHTQVPQSEDTQEEDEREGRARRRRARESKDEVVQGDQARAHSDRAGILAVGVLTILSSAWGALIPFAEPIFGFHATGTPSLRWNAAHTLLAVVPGGIGVAMGFVVLWAAGRIAGGRGRMILVWAGLITLLSGAWFIVGPRAWPVITTHGVYFAPASPLRGLLYQVAYALGTGVILVVCGGYVMGWASRQMSESAAVSSDVASVPMVVLPARVVPTTAAKRGRVSADAVRRDRDSSAPTVYDLLNRRE